MRVAATDPCGGAPASTGPEARHPRRRRVRLLGLAAVGLVLGSHWVIEPVRVSSDSMSPTLAPGNHIVLLRSPWSGAVARGDVVVIGPGWAERSSSQRPATAGPVDGTSLVKRVVAVGGDVVGLEDGELVVNGVHVPEPWVDAESVDGVWFGPVAVPTGALFLMGDDRARSVDSRDLGPARLEDVDGRVLTPWPTG